MQYFYCFIEFSPYLCTAIFGLGQPSGCGFKRKKNSTIVDANYSRIFRVD